MYFRAIKLLPISTLFPYTTLFRSRGRPGCRRCRDRAADPGRRARAGACQDRKSTRLNSSHVAISYAVFCLKKNNITNVVTEVESKHLRKKISSQINPKYLSGVKR